MKKLKAGLGQAAIYLAALVISKATAVLMLPVFTHYLTPEEYGRLDIIQTLANLVSIVIGFGLADALFRFAGEAASEEERREQAAEVFGLSLALAVISLIITQAAAPFIAALLPGEVSILQTRIILASLSLSAAILVPLGWLRFRDKAPLYFVGTAGRTLVQAGLVALFLAFGFGIDGVLTAGLICAASLAILLCVIQFRDTGARLSLETFTRQGRFGGMLVVAGIATFILDSCDRWILAGAVGPEALANYALAGKIGIMSAFLTQPFELWWLPKRFAVLRSQDGAAQCARMTEFGICVAILSAIAVSGVAAFVVNWMTPIEYAGAALFVPALAMLAALNVATTLVTTGVLSDTRTGKPIWIDWSTAAVALALYLALIPPFGAWGAVVATVIAMGLRFSLYLWAGHAKALIPYRWGRLSVVALGGIVTAAGCTLEADPAAAFLIGLVGGIAVLIVAMALRLIPIAQVIAMVRPAEAAAA